MEKSMGNIDLKTVDGFGDEWEAYSQETMGVGEHQRLFERYFSIFPFKELPTGSEGFDLGCGTGRWAALVAQHVGRLHCIDPAKKALNVARRRLSDFPNASFHLAGVDDIPLPDNSQDFGYSLGVLHHIPDTEAAMAACVRKLKPEAPFLIYIYYAFDNKPVWFRRLWKVSDLARRVVSKLPFPLRRFTSVCIASTVYMPLSIIARGLELRGHDVSTFPLSSYRNTSFYTMKTDALDRFGTRLEQRFSRAEIEAMMLRSGLRDVVFQNGSPYWVACGRKRAEPAE